METIHHTNIFSSSHSRRTCPTVGVLSHGFTDSPLWAGIADTAGQRGVTLIGFAGGIPASPHGFEAQANVLFDLVNPEIIDGLIVDSDMLCHYIGMPALRAFCDRYPLPLVSSGVPLNGIPSVLLDFSQGMRDVLAHLIETHGYRRIAFIRGPATSRTGEERYTAYQEALAAYEIAFDPQLVTPGSFYAPSGADAIRLLYDDRKVQVDAIVAANDFMAIDAMHALQVRGIRVPEDVAVVGFDDMEEARAGTPPLTTVNFCIHDRSLHLMELLLANMAGEHAPEQVSLSPSLIVRESCGCRSAAVMEASAATVSNVVGTPPTFASQRNSLLAAIGQIPTVRSKDIPRIATLFDGFVTDIMNPSAGVFLAVWQDIVRRAWTTGSDFSCWQRVLSMLRNGLRPCFDSVATLTQAENLWQQARILLGEALERAQHVQRIQREHQFVHLRKISQSLIATFDVAELMNLLIRELSQIGVLSCFLALYDDPDTPTGTARLLLAYTDHNRISLPAEGYRFPAIQLIPPEFFPQERRMTLIMDALYFQEVQLGFVLFELDTDSQILHTSGIRNENPLCGEISSALQGALLVRRIREHAAQVTRQQYILDTFMANVPDAIYFKDTESRFIRANRAMARTFDVHDPADLAGKTDFDLFPESQAQSKYEQEQEILCNGQALVSLEEPDAQGGWVSTTKMPLRDEHGSIIGTFGVSRDITALKQTEQELRQYRTHLEELVAERTCDLSRTNTRLRDEIIERRQVEADLIQSNSRLHDEIVERQRIEQALRAGEEQYRTLAENVTDGILIVQNDRLEFANQAFSRMLGIPPQSLELSVLLRLWRRPDRQPIDWLNPKTSPTPMPRRQVEMTTRHGHSMWTEIESTAIVWNGHPAILLTIHDVTDRKLREQRLEKERIRLYQENVTLKSTIKERYRFGGLIGKSQVMQRVYEQIISAAGSDVNVLVCGDSGVGKELIARTLHQVSLRKSQAFVPVNCASIPETLFEREFFGHRRGAFTGADRNTPGFFDRAHQGILFLDEVTEFSPGTQAKLLRVLQDGEYFPVGSNAPKQADVLVVAATNKDPQTEIRHERLRKDFFYRICVITIDMPPLRERKDDLPLLIEALLGQYRTRYADLHGQAPQDFPTDQTMLPTELIQAVYLYDWPGNVRELQNVLQRYLATHDLNAVLPGLGIAARSRGYGMPDELPVDLKLPEAVEILEKRMIVEALKQTNHHIGHTVELLGVPRRTLERKIKRYRLK